MGAIGYFISRNTNPANPKNTMTYTSNILCDMAKGPMTQSTYTTGINFSRGIARTFTSILVNDKP